VKIGVIRVKSFGAMKSKKKKVAFPRRTWQINPVTRVKSSAKKYSRPRVKQDFQKSDEQEIKIWSAEGQFAGRHH
jgi:hypothetical protein